MMMEESEITLDEWLQEQMALLQMFAMWYRANHRMNPEHFPERLTPGEWDEQAQTFDPSGASE